MWGTDVEVILTTWVEQLNGKWIVCLCSFLLLWMWTLVGSTTFPIPSPIHAVTRMHISFGWEGFEVLWAAIYPHQLSSCPWTWCYRKFSSYPTEAIVSSTTAVCCCRLVVASAFSTYRFWIPFPQSGHVSPAVSNHWELLSSWLLLCSVVSKAFWGAFGINKKRQHVTVVYVLFNGIWCCSSLCRAN